MLAGGARSKGAAGGRGSSRLRTIDRTLVRSLLRIVGAVKRRRPLPSRLHRIGLMKSTGIGDMILTTAIARDVMAAHPDAEFFHLPAARGDAQGPSQPDHLLIETKRNPP